MNPLLRAQLDRIDAAIRELADASDRRRRDLDSVAQERDRLQQEQWVLRRAVSAMQHASEDYDRVADECRLLREREAELRKRLETVLAAAKSLASELRS